MVQVEQDAGHNAHALSVHLERNNGVAESRNIRVFHNPADILFRLPYQFRQCRDKMLLPDEIERWCLVQAHKGLQQRIAVQGIAHKRMGLVF